MPREKEFDRNATLQAAMTAFWSRGYEATSMQDLVDCMGVNRGSLYATFGDKRALFLAALELYDDERRRMLSSFQARQPPKEAIRQVFLAFTCELRTRGGNKGCFITNTALELSAHDREIRKRVAAAQADVETFFARMVEDGQRRGEIASSLDPASTARGLLATLTGLLVLIRSRPERELLDAIVEDAIGRLG